MTAAHQVVLLASNADANVSAWDLATGTHLTTYRSNASPRNGLCLVGADYLLAAQLQKDMLQFWTWHKDQVLQRSFTVERMTAVAASQGGLYIASGGVSGSVYLWETGSGRLLRTWAAHYKAVTAVTFLDAGSVLVSASEDTLANVWLLSELLDVTQDPASAQYARPQPLYSWSDHTLPITAVHSGVGEAAAVVATAGLDRNVKIYSMSSGKLLHTLVMPAAVLCLAMDSGEHAVYAGCADGMIYEASLLEVDDSNSIASSRSNYVQLEGHSKAVNSLALSVDGDNLVSGSEDGTARVWDLRTRQPIQVINSPSKHAVTSVIVLPKPHHLSAGGSTSATGSSGRQGPKRPQALAPLQKYVGVSGSLKKWEGAPVVLDGSLPFMNIAAVSGLASTSQPQVCDLQNLVTGSVPSFDLLSQTGGIALRTAGMSVLLQRQQQEKGKTAAGDGDMQMENVVELKGEVEQLKAELAAAHSEALKWKGLHADLHQFCLQQVTNEAGAIS